MAPRNVGFFTAAPNPVSPSGDVAMVSPVPRALSAVTRASCANPAEVERAGRGGTGAGAGAFGLLKKQISHLPRYSAAPSRNMPASVPVNIAVSHKPIAIPADNGVSGNAAMTWQR